MQQSISKFFTKSPKPPTANGNAASSLASSTTQKLTKSSEPESHGPHGGRPGTKRPRPESPAAGTSSKRRPVVESKSKPARNASPAMEPLPRSDQWQCIHCTLINPGHASICETCQQAPAVTPSRDTPVLSVEKVTEASLPHSSPPDSLGQVLGPSDMAVEFQMSVNEERAKKFQRGLGDIGGSEGASWGRSRTAVSDSDGLFASVLHVKPKQKGAQKYTPMEQQVIELKRQNPDVLLLVECGYRYRFFGEDAQIAAKILRIYAYIDHSFYVASIPTFRLAVHVRRLVEAGHKVGVVRQTESAALKSAGLTGTTKSSTFRRELVAVFTQATWFEGAVDPLLPASLQGAGGGDDKEEGGAGLEEDATEVAALDADQQSEQALREQWLLALYEEDVSGGPAGEGQPVSLAIALRDEGSEGDPSDVKAVRLGLVAVDVRSGVVVHDSFTDDPQRMELDTRLRHLQPLELLLPAPAMSRQTEKALGRFMDGAVDSQGRPRVVRTERSTPEVFCFDHAQGAVSQFYSSKHAPLDAMEVEEGGDGVRSHGETSPPPQLSALDLPRPCICAFGPLLEHLKRFGLHRALSQPQLKPFASAAYMTLDAVTMRDLEILACQADGKEAGSLLWLLKHTSTPFGYRILKDWVRKPLLQREAILARQQAVKELAFEPPPCLEPLCSSLRGLADLDPAVASLHFLKIPPKRLLSLLTSLQQVADVIPGASVRDAQVQSQLLQQGLAALPADLPERVGRFLTELDEEAAKKDDFTRVLVGGETYSEKLAVANRSIQSLNGALQEELKRIRQVLKKPTLLYKTLRTGVTSEVEFLVELRKIEAKKLVPSDWVQASQTKDMVRYHTPQVLKLHQELLQSREQQAIAAKEAWGTFLKSVDDECYEAFRQVVSFLGTLDVLLSLAKVAQMPGYTCPSYDLDSDAETGGDPAAHIQVSNGRHPMVESVMEGNFVPNDVELSGSFGPRGCLVVTGPNMGGKSSYVRMVALICVMGQIGCFVPAESARLAILDGVFTRMGAGDDLAAGVSTFMVELWHTSYILQRATPRSLVILDELGRGTSTHDGVAIALATLRHIVRDVGCATLFVTHYPQLTSLANDPDCKGRVINAHMAFLEGSSEQDDGEAAGAAEAGLSHRVTFLYKLVEGQAHRSFGLNVARMAGVDRDVVALAAVKAQEMRELCRLEGDEGTVTPSGGSSAPADLAKLSDLAGLCSASVSVEQQQTILSELKVLQGRLRQARTATPH